MTKFNINIDECDDIKSHELKTIRLLMKYGDVKLLKPSRIKGVHTPDVIWLGLKWEIKSPKGKGKSLIHNTISKALKQSENIIIDFGRLQISELNALRLVKKYAPEFKKMKRLKVITRSGKVLDIKGGKV